nr:C-type lectin domain family 4 member G-like [Loxodonta africana]
MGVGANLYLCPGLGACTAMDNFGYSKWGNGAKEASRGHWGLWGRKSLLVALALFVVVVLWALVLSILFSKASTERGALLGSQDQLWTNASKQKAALGVLETLHPGLGVP